MPVVPGLGLHDVREDVAVRQHRALRRARRAAGVLQHGEIVGVDVDARQLRSIVAAGQIALSASVSATLGGGAAARRNTLPAT